MYAGVVVFHVKRGKLEEAIKVWKEVLLPAAASLPGYKGAMLLTDADVNKMMGIGLWETKKDADAWTTTGAWKWGSELRMKFEALLSEEAVREELQVEYLQV